MGNSYTLQPTISICTVSIFKANRSGLADGELHHLEPLFSSVDHHRLENLEKSSLPPTRFSKLQTLHPQANPLHNLRANPPRALLFQRDNQLGALLIFHPQSLQADHLEHQLGSPLESRQAIPHKSHLDSPLVAPLVNLHVAQVVNHRLNPLRVQLLPFALSAGFTNAPAFHVQLARSATSLTQVSALCALQAQEMMFWVHLPAQFVRSDTLASAVDHVSSANPVGLLQALDPSRLTHV